jgi:anti-sigma B factor antagonist
MKTEFITIAENFSVNEASKFRELTYGILKENQVSFELDFSKCQFIDSTGLGVLVGLYKKCVEFGGTVILSNLTSNVSSVIRMTRLDQIFTIK